MRIKASRMQTLSFVFFALLAFSLVDIGQIVAGVAILTLGLILCIKPA